MKIYEVLNSLNIEYDELIHKAVYTAEEAKEEKISSLIEGLECKNLFLKYKDEYYLVFILASKRADLKKLAHLVNRSRLTFANLDELKQVLDLNLGSVTPLGIVNDTDLKVKLLIDSDVVGKKVLLHSDSNTKTLSLNYDDLIRFIEYTDHEYMLF